MEWTRGELGAAERRFLAELPLSLTEDGRLYVHADASDPKRWRYVTDVDGAGRSMMATSADVTFCGHVHRPALYTLSATGKMSSFTPVTGSGHSVAAEPALACRARFGRAAARRQSGGRLRDAGYREAELTYCRVPYDIEAAAAKHPRQRACRPGSPTVFRWASETWPSTHRMDWAQTIDGFRIEERVHDGGMATHVARDARKPTGEAPRSRC